MPKKLMKDEQRYPSLVAERTALWGRTIHAGRLSMRLTAAELAQRAQVSESTLRRLERGDPGGSAGAYLSVINVLGYLSELAPLPPTPVQAPVSRSGMAAKRVRHGTTVPGDDDYF